MTIDEMGQILDALKVVYPHYYKTYSEDEKFQISCLWAEMFEAEPVGLVLAAVKSFIATDTKGFPPAIGQIKEQIVKLTKDEEKSELEAWGEVKKALSNSGYNAVTEFDKLDPAIKRIVGAPSQLRDWASVETGALDSVIASNFQRSYRAIAKNERERAVLPPEVAEMVKQLADAKAMDAQPQEPKGLPISIEATVNHVKREIGEATRAFKAAECQPLSDEEFKKRQAEILAMMETKAQ